MENSEVLKRTDAAAGGVHGADHVDRAGVWDLAVVEDTELIEKEGMIRGGGGGCSR
mgnify:CR=1 FL=1